MSQPENGLRTTYFGTGHFPGDGTEYPLDTELGPISPYIIRRSHPGHHSRYHRFFSNAAWSLDDLYESLAREAIATFYPLGLIRSALDDTLGRKRGLTIFATGMHNDARTYSRA